MKFLAVSDVVMPVLYCENIRERFADVDAVLSCGDLPPEYIDYIVSMLDVPLFYVLGNHDTSIYKKLHREYASRYKRLAKNFGGMNLDRNVVDFRGVLIGGFEGSIKYNNPILQYTEFQMKRRVLKMVPKLLFNKIRKGRFIDILITHAPPFGIHDRKDPCHTGFKVFKSFISLFKPKYMIHGHIHIYDNITSIKDEYKNTTVLNTYGYQVIEI